MLDTSVPSLSEASKPKKNQTNKKQKEKGRERETKMWIVYVKISADFIKLKMNKYIIKIPSWEKPIIPNEVKF